MPAPKISIDDEALGRQGYALVPDLVSASDLEAFEAAIRDFCAAYGERRGEGPSGADPFVVILQRD